MSWPAPVYLDASPSTARRCGLPVLGFPIPGVNVAYILTEKWMQLLANSSTWTPLALNTAHPEYTGFVLVEESPLSDEGGGFVTWTRKYAKVPSAHIEYDSYLHNRIGY